MSTLIFFVNGKKVIEKCPDPEQTLLSYLRDNLHLCGTKLGCGEGGCGACTVMISKINRTTNEIKHLAVNACLTPICSVHGTAITTVEGIGSTKTKLHPVQERIAKAHGSQCGFCTPGMVMSMYALLRSSPKPSMKDLETTFQGNLCRCTGYRPIIEGYRTFTSENCAMGEKCCKNGGPGPDDANNVYEESEFTPYDPSQEPIFPPELKLSSNLDEESLTFSTSRVTWFRPTNLKHLLEIKRDNPNVKIINGNTEVGVEVKFKHFHYPHLATPALIPEMIRIETLETGLNIGSAVTLIEMETKMKEQIKELPEYQTRLFKAVVDMLHYFAGKQIRNVASVGGNIMTGSPISDLNPIFMAAGIELEVASAERGSRKINIGLEFFTGYRRNIIEPDEILISIFIPRTEKDQYFLAYKQAKRRDDDIAIVNAAINVFFDPGTDVINKISLSFGGMAPTTVLAPKTSKAVVGMKWNSEMLEILNKELIEELPLDPSAPGGMILYRRSLTLSLFFKAYLEISERLEKQLIERTPISNHEKSGSKLFHTLTPKSAQFYDQVPKDQSYHDPIGRPEVHQSTFKHASGEAVYCDDIPRYENELYLAFVLSKKAHATIISIDATDALNIPGVVEFYSAKDLKPNLNMVGALFQDEEIFVSKKVTSQGQILGAIIADNQKIAQRAARMVKVEYEQISPIIVSIEDAIKYQSFYPGYPKKLIKGDVEKAFRESDHVIEGECRLGGQEHFYLETQVALAIPSDSDELLIYSSTQHPSGMQRQLSKMLEIPANKIVTKSKRLGGGFGGKEFKASMVGLPVALAAYRLGRPVRCMLDRDEDMMITAGRHPFLFKYKIGCTRDGKITGCEIDIFNNAGYSMDMSFAVLERTFFHFESAYVIPNVKCSGWVCKTNIPSNTAFRGFGSPQALLSGELMIRDVAKAVGKNYIEVIELNMYRKGDWTHYNSQMEDDNIKRCWDEVLRNSNFIEKEKAVTKFNQENRWRKRGISAVPSKYGIGFGISVLNQAGALVHIYTDGSVLISHGGTEMGQGLHTKMIQVASKILEIPTDRIHISETSTDKVPNTGPTAASFSSDLNGTAVLDACNKLKDRLAPICKKFSDKDWNFWINKAYMERISLSATGYSKILDITYNLETNTGSLYLYYTYGAAVSEVEIDCLTGDHQVIRTDIVMDLGTSMNPAIDIGQIEGAFIQGYGLYTLEEMIYSPAGEILSKGPGAYKIPAFSDIPGELNVSLLKGSSEPRAVFSSKAVGEPPLGLAVSVFLAIKEAIVAARLEENLSSDFYLESPATSARIRMACSDSITKNFKLPEKDTFKPWNVEA